MMSTFDSDCARLRARDSNVRQAAAKALGQLGDARAVNPLCARLGDRVPDVRQAVVTALVKLGGARAVEPLCARLGNWDSDVRRAAAEVLGQLGWKAERTETAIWWAIAIGDWSAAVLQLPEAVEPLCARLGDRDSGVRQAAATALGQLGDARAVAPLCSCLQDRADSVRQTTVMALRTLNSRAALPALRARLGWFGVRETDREIRQQIQEAIASINGSTQHLRALPVVVANPGPRAHELPVPAGGPPREE